MTRQDRAPQKLTIENLESRRLLAGDVMADVIDGRLVVTGDEADNQVHISSGENAGEYVIAGIPAPDGTNTTVNGQDGPVLVTGVTGGTRIVTGDGNDLVDVSHAHFKNLAIATGAGDDSVRIGVSNPTPDPTSPSPGDETPDGGEEGTTPVPPDVEPSVVVRGQFRLRTGVGNDNVVERSLVVHRGHSIRTGAGEDNVILGASRPDDGRAEDGETAGDPSSVAPPETAHSALNVRGALMIGTGGGSDNLVLHAADAQSVHIRTGAANDHVLLDQVHGHNGIWAQTGGGDDTIAMNHVRARWAWMLTGQGGDHVALHDASFAILGIYLGGGDDGLEMRDTQVGRMAFIAGGDDTDSFVKDAATHLAHAHVTGFELPPRDGGDGGDGDDL